MRIAELSATSAVPVPTIKYYVREGLLPPGRATAVNQADYGDAHVRRLSLIRALIDIGGLSIVTAKDVISAVDSDDIPLSGVFERAQLAVSQTDVYTSHGSTEGRDRIEALIHHNGWRVSDTNPGRTAAANVIDALTALDHTDLIRDLEAYAQPALAVAKVDLDAVAKQTDAGAMAEIVVIGTVLGDALFAALRRIAQEHVTSERFPADRREQQSSLGLEKRRASS